MTSRASKMRRPPLDRNYVLIKVGNIVSIRGQTSFDDNQGLVMDTASDLEPDDGPIAVFFDGEVENHHFGPPRLSWDKWKGPKPTVENYRESDRMVCFNPRDLVVESEWSIETLAYRLFGRSMWHHTNSLKYRLIPNVWDCQFGDCISGELATERAIVNYWGSVYEVYSCADCYSKKSGMCTESLLFKNPLPGTPFGPEPDRVTGFGWRYHMRKSEEERKFLDKTA